MECNRRVTAEINLNAIVQNYEEIKKLLSPGTRILPVIKADAYGHGAIEVAKALIKAGSDYFAVAIYEEAMMLREHGINAPILIMGYTVPGLIPDVVRYNIAQTVFTQEMAQAISNVALIQNKVAKIHIKIDTGMGRIGFHPDHTAITCIKNISRMPGLEIEGIYTHLSSADEKDKSFTFRQIFVFLDFAAQLENAGVSIPIRHTANSACIIDIREGHLDMVRPGLSLYGMYPSEDVNKPILGLKPAMTLKSQIVYIKDMEPGMPVSYGRTFITEKNSRIATIPVGYADGYPRRLSSKGRVIIKGQYAPIAGRICMDQFMVDVTHIPGVNTGDEVILMGSDGRLSVTAEEIAEITGTINYEVVCNISERVPRVYY